MDISLSMESEHLFRGIKRGGPVINPGVWLGLYQFYLGSEWVQPLLSETDPNQVDSSFGWGTEVWPGVAVDIGATYRSYPDSDRARSREVYLGVELEGIGDEGWLARIYPRIYGLYDFDDQGGTFSTIGSLVYDLYLNEWLEGQAIWLRFEPFIGWANPESGRDWLFYGVKLDLNYALAAGVTASVGGRYSGKNRKGGLLGENSDNLWWGAALRFGF